MKENNELTLIDADQKQIEKLFFKIKRLQPKAATIYPAT